MSTGINHLEVWVSNVKLSMDFYRGFLEKVGWKQINSSAFATHVMEIYFVERKNLKRMDTLGIRHLCFQASDKNQIIEIHKYLISIKAKVIRGPIEQCYSPNYFTIDFYDPDGLIIEVAFTPHLKFIVA